MGLGNQSEQQCIVAMNAMRLLKTRQLDVLGKRLHEDGKFGCDYAPLSKEQKMQFILGEALTIYATDAATQDYDVGAHISGLVEGILSASDEPGNDDPDDVKGNTQATQTLGKGDGSSVESELPCFKYEPDTRDCQDETCDYDDGAACPKVDDTPCDECGVEHQGAKYHERDPDTNAMCPQEQLMDEMHEGHSSCPFYGKPMPEGVDQKLVDLIRQVTHMEHDPTFKRVESVLKSLTGMLVRSDNQQIADIAKLQEEMREALKIAKESKRRKLTAASEVIFKVPNLPGVSVANRHPVAFPKAFALMSLDDEYRQPIYFYGEAGSGKSTLGEHLAMALGLFPDDYSAISCSGDMMSSKLMGRILPIGMGRYIPSELIRRLLLQRPFLFVFDEYDSPPPEVQVGLNTFLANDAMYVEERSFSDEPVRIVKPHGTRIVAAGNTLLGGANARYPGRQQQDGASRDRWVCLKVEENPAVAASICGGVEYEPLPIWVPQEYSNDDLKTLLHDAHVWYLAVKKAINAKKTQQLVTVRTMLRARACLMAGFTWDETKEVLLAGWKPDELDQIGEASMHGRV